MATNTTTDHPTDEPSLTLRTLRDEIRVRLHLASMEARERWERLDAEAEKLLHRTGHASKQVIDELVGRLQELRRSLDSH
jgi:hypothetical protein